MKPESQPRTYYAIWLFLLGFILGLPFVLLGSAIAILLAGLPPSLDALILVQSSQPLLWIIDTIPFLLAIALGMLGSRLDAARRLRWQASRAIHAREAEIERLNREIAAQETARTQLDVVIGRGKPDWGATFDAVADMILITDADGKVLRCNRATSQAFQQGFEDLVGRQIENLFFGSAEGGAFPIPAHKVVMKFPKLEGWYEVSSHPIELEEGRTATIYIIRDITKQQQTIQDLARQMEYYQALVHNSPFAIVTLNKDGRVVACNPAFENIFGYSEQEAIGQDIDLLVAPPEMIAETRALTQAVLRGEVVHVVTRRRKKGAAPGTAGEPFDAEVFGIPFVLRGRQIGILAIYHDVSQLLSPRGGTEGMQTTGQPPAREGSPLEAEETETTMQPPMEGAASLAAQGETPDAPSPTTEAAAPTLPPAEGEAMPVEESEASSAPAPFAEAESEWQPPGAESRPQAADVDAPRGSPATPVEESAERGSSAGTESWELSEGILRMIPVTSLEGIGSAYASRLGEQGIHSVDDLLKAAADAEGRQALAEATGLTLRQITRWVNFADLMRVTSLRKEYLPLLEAAGVETLVALQICNPQNLFNELQRLIAEKNPNQRVPSLQEVEAWVAAAQGLEVIVH